MLFHFFRTAVAKTVSWLTLDHLWKAVLVRKLILVIVVMTLTLLMKSAASSDQPFGTSLSLIWIYLERMWSRISFLDLPM